MPSKLYDQAIQQLSNAGAGLRCNDLIQVLQSLGFTVDSRNSGGHKTYVSKALSDVSPFKTGNFNGGHGSNAEVKPFYVKNVLKLLRLYETELRELNKD